MDYEKLHDYSEYVADIAFKAGHYRLRISNDSRIIIQKVIEWAVEFHKLYKDEDWQEKEYIDTIEEFISQKISQYIRSFESKCPNCTFNTLIYEIVENPGLEPEARIVCESCGIIIEDRRAERILLDALIEEYKGVLVINRKSPSKIEKYIKDQDHIKKLLYLHKRGMTQSEVLKDFQSYKKQRPIPGKK